MRVCLTIPTHNGTVSTGTMQGAFCATTRHTMDLVVNTCSLLAHGFNQLWLHAVTESGADWFAMLHADIAPPAGWLDTLIDRAEAAHADICAAHAAIKAPPGHGQHGHTSTAWLPEKGPPVPLTGAHLAELPPTFDAADLERHFGQPGMLGLNTGCWVARLNRPWNRCVSFSIGSSIDWGTDPPQCRVISEDWRFSHLAALRGAHLIATHLDELGHIGPTTWTLHPWPRTHASGPQGSPATDAPDQPPQNEDMTDNGVLSASAT